jgi:choline dehydrogenase
MSTAESFDYIVIGAGSAGCIVAARLAETRMGTVLLLETGAGEEQNPEILAADGFKDAFANDHTMHDRLSLPQGKLVKRPIYAGSGRGMGGSGSVNGTVYTRGDAQDFACWPSGWQWDDVVPAYEAVEQRLRVRFRQPTALTERCIRAAESIGFTQKNSLNDGDLNGFIGYNDMNFEGELRRSSYVAFILDNAAAQLDLLTIRTHSTLQRIIFDDNKTAVAIEYCESGVTKQALIRREIILCAGALETPKLLMLSGVGPQPELAKFAIPPVLHVESIGKNLQDHPMVCLFYEGKQASDFGFPQLYGFHRFNTALSLPDTQADTCLTLFAAAAVMRHTLHRMMPLMLLPQALYRYRILRRAIRTAVDTAFKLPPLKNFVSRLYGVVVILGKPVSRGQLRLRSVNPSDSAHIDLAYFAHADDLTTITAGIQQTLQMMQHPSMAEWGNKLVSTGAASSDEQTLQKWIEKSVATSFHFAGTCTMGEADHAPVDSRLRLKGTRNVRVADASVIPEVPVSALNAPTMMIGYRAVEFIREDSLNRADAMNHSDISIEPTPLSCVQ